MKNLIRVMSLILMIIFLVVGIGILLYPDFMNWRESRRHVGFIQEYNANVALMAEAEIEYELNRARIFNEGITDISINDPWGEGANDISGTAEYYTLLNLGHNGVMGRIEIPVINIDLPIFHGSSSAVLDRGVGHMPHTSLPIGGYGNHSILTAHTGMVNSRLFTDLIYLDYGERFVITVATKRIAYEVVERNIVLPHQIEGLQTYADRDLVTLVTCYPYGFNTHRLLVLGERIPYYDGMLDDIESIVGEINIRHLAVIGILAFVILISIFRWLKAKKRKNGSSENSLDQKYEKEYNEMFGD